MHLSPLYAYYGPTDALLCRAHGHVHDMGPVDINIYTHQECMRAVKVYLCHSILLASSERSIQTSIRLQSSIWTAPHLQ
jgi:hypothetical protein